MKFDHYSWRTLLALFLVAPLCFTACSPPKPPAKDVPPVLVAKASLADIPVFINPPPVGHVMAYSTVTVRPQIGGEISEIHFQEGQAVKQGDLLFSIDPRPAQAALAGAKSALARDEAQLANAQIQFEREQKLYEQKIESQDAFDSTRATRDALLATVANDRAAVTNAQLNVEYTQIRSPLEGVTGQYQFHEGNVVKSPDDTLVVINQIHPIYVIFAVPERYLPEIQQEMKTHKIKVTTTYDNQVGPPPEGELVFVDNAVDYTTGTILLKAQFANENNSLWPGQYVQVDLLLHELDQAVVVPTQALQTGQKGTFLYVLNADQTVDERLVTNGPAYEGNTVIENGVKAGETVVTDGQLRLEPQLKVTVKTDDQPAP